MTRDSKTSTTNRYKDAAPEIQKHVERLAKAHYLLYADGSKSLLVVLQALDAGGKDGVLRHVFTAMNCQLLGWTEVPTIKESDRRHPFSPDDPRTQFFFTPTVNKF